MKIQIFIVAIVLLLSACASDSAREDASVRPADRSECQVASSSSAEQLARSKASAMVRDPCHPNDSLRWSAEQRGETKLDFSGKHD